MMLYLFPVFLGSFFIVMGILSKFYPNIIAGYSEGSDHKTPLYIMKISIITGLIIIIGGVLSAYFKFSPIYYFFLTIPCLIMPFCILKKIQKTSQSSIKKPLFILVSIILLTTIFLVYSITEPTIKIENKKLEISGLYGETISINEIEHLFLRDTISKIKMRTNGFSFGQIKKGNFTFQDDKKAKLFLQSNSGPYIIIEAKLKEPIIINFQDSLKTIKIYHKLKNNK